MPAPAILLEPRRVVRLAAAAVTASARGFGGTLAEQRHLRLVLRPTATAGQVLAQVLSPLLGASHARPR